MTFDDKINLFLMYKSGFIKQEKLESYPHEDSISDMMDAQHYAHRHRQERPEDFRRILVGHRRSGKTTQLLEIAIQELEHRDVHFFVSHNGMIRHIVERLIDLDIWSLARKTDRSFQHIKSGNRLHVIYERDNHRPRNSGNQYDRPFRVLDELRLDDYDLISITGTPFYDERERHYGRSPMEDLKKRMDMEAMCSPPPERSHKYQEMADVYERIKHRAVKVQSFDDILKDDI